VFQAFFCVTWSLSEYDPKAQVRSRFWRTTTEGYNKIMLRHFLWYRRAAEQRPRAEDALGYKYLTAKPSPQDYAQAFRWYKERR